MITFGIRQVGFQSSSRGDEVATVIVSNDNDQSAVGLFLSYSVFVADV